MVRLEMAACIWLSGNCSSPVITHPFIHLYSHYHQHTSINYFSYKLLSCWSFPATTFSLPPYNLKRITFISHPFSQWLHNCTSTNATHVLLSRSPVTSNLLVKSASTVFFWQCFRYFWLSFCHGRRYYWWWKTGIPHPTTNVCNMAPLPSMLQSKHPQYAVVLLGLKRRK